MSKAAIAEKEKFVDAFAEELKAAKAILVINYLGLTVEEVTNMRKELRDNDVKMKVIKNTYLRRAAAKAGI
ncbi:50S ribosomal protein L10, partial [Lactobacillus crispatus]